MINLGRLGLALVPRFTVLRGLCAQQPAATCILERRHTTCDQQAQNARSRGSEGQEHQRSAQAAEVVRYFCHLSESRGPELPDLGPVRAMLNQCVAALSFDELAQMVAALALWPEATRSRAKLLMVPTREEHDIREILNILKKESNRRLWRESSEEEDYISVTYSNIGNILKMCELWNAVDKIFSFSSKSFSTIVLNKLGNECTSKSKFKHFDKDTFVEFVRLVNKIQLSETFHIYYCTVKFVDLLPLMNQSEIGTVCQTFVGQRFVHDRGHPMEVRLRQLLLGFSLAHLDELTSRNLGLIARLVGINFPTSLIPTALELQRRIMEEKIMERLSPSTLVEVGSLFSELELFRRSGVYLPYWDAVVKQLSCWQPQLLLEKLLPDHLASLAAVICLHRDTPHGRALLMALCERLVSSEAFRSGGLHHVNFLLHMAHLGLYNLTAIDMIFSSPQLTKETSRGIELLDKIRFAARSCRQLGGMILCLQGMVEMECPNYTGRKINVEWADIVRLWIHSVSPSLAGPELLDRLWVQSGLQVYGRLEELVGENKVLETYVMPFSGQINYVILLDSSGYPLHIPDKLRHNPSNQVVRADRSLGEWMMFSLVNPDRNVQAQARTGGQLVVQRLAHKLGYSHATVNTMLLARMDLSSQRNHIRNLILQRHPNAQLVA